LSPQEAIAVIDGAVRADRDNKDLADDDVRPMLVLDVRFRPNYWIGLKSTAACLRRKDWKAVIDAAEKLFDLDVESGRPGRNTVDGLREADVMSIITPAWRAACG